MVSSGAGLGGHRRRLGHAVADGHVGHVHRRDRLLHHLHRTRRTGHDPGAQRRQVELAEPLVAELGDEHRRHAVERRAPFVLHGLQGGQRVERGGRVDDRGAVRGAPEVAHHHAEAVVQRYRHAHPVVLGVPAPLADEVAVVEDVAVRQRGALGEAGGAAGVLDVDRIVGRERRRPVAQCLHRGPFVVLEPVVPVVVAEVPEELQLRQRRSHRGHHRHVVAALELGGRHQPTAPRLAQRVLQFVGAVRRVDVHQHHADLRRGVLDERPLHAVRRPDADPVTDPEAFREQAARHQVDLAVELAICHPRGLVHRHDRLVVGEPGRGGLEVRTDGLIEQRYRDVAGGGGSGDAFPHAFPPHGLRRGRSSEGTHIRERSGERVLHSPLR